MTCGGHDMQTVGRKVSTDDEEPDLLRWEDDGGAVSRELAVLGERAARKTAAAVRATGNH